MRRTGQELKAKKPKAKRAGSTGDTMAGSDGGQGPLECVVCKAETDGNNWGEVVGDSSSHICPPKKRFVFFFLKALGCAADP